MKTTVTLDLDILVLLNEELKHNGGTFSEALNEALRRGLCLTPRVEPMDALQSSQAPFQMEPPLPGPWNAA